jgi:hypothetical protein
MLFTPIQYQYLFDCLPELMDEFVQCICLFDCISHHHDVTHSCGRNMHDRHPVIITTRKRKHSKAADVFMSRNKAADFSCCSGGRRRGETFFGWR